MKIAFSGKVLTGKTTLARALEPWGFTRLSFADPLKDYACAEFGITREQLEANKDQYREFLQNTGQAMKAIHNDLLYWTNQLLVKVDMMPDVRNVVVDDTRFPYELEPLLKRGFLHVKLIVPEATRLYRGKLKYGDAFELKGNEHESETALDDYTENTLIVTNDIMMDRPEQFARYLLHKLLAYEINKETWWKLL
jgi:hypothetical protein